MKGKLTAVAVAIAFAMMAMPGTASAHYHKRTWTKDCMTFGWVHNWKCWKWKRSHRWW